MSVEFLHLENKLGERVVSFKEQNADLSAVFVAHRPQLQRAALKILGNMERAQDVVQDAYVKVMEAQSVFDVKQPLAYLHQMVRNLAIDMHRRAALETRFFISEEEGMQVPEHYGTPETAVIHRQDLRTIADALAELPARTRRAFELHRLSGLTQREIADKLGVSTTLVNFMIRDALNHCRAALKKM